MHTHTTQTKQVGVFPCRGLVAPCQRAPGSIKGLPRRCQCRRYAGGLESARNGAFAHSEDAWSGLAMSMRLEEIASSNSVRASTQLAFRHR